MSAINHNEPTVLSVSTIEKHRNRRQANAIRRLAEQARNLYQDQTPPLLSSPVEPKNAERDFEAVQESSALERGAKQ